MVQGSRTAPSGPDVVVRSGSYASSLNASLPAAESVSKRNLEGVGADRSRRVPSSLLRNREWRARLAEVNAVARNREHDGRVFPSPAIQQLPTCSAPQERTGMARPDARCGASPLTGATTQSSSGVNKRVVQNAGTRTGSANAHDVDADVGNMCSSWRCPANQEAGLRTAVEARSSGRTTSERDHEGDVSTRQGSHVPRPVHGGDGTAETIRARLRGVFAPSQPDGRPLPDLTGTCSFASNSSPHRVAQYQSSVEPPGYEAGCAAGDWRRGRLSGSDDDFLRSHQRADADAVPRQWTQVRSEADTSGPSGGSAFPDAALFHAALSPEWTQLPSWEDILGATPHRESLPRNAPLHVKAVPRINIQRVRELYTASPSTKADFEEITGWLSDDNFYAAVPVCTAADILETKISNADIKKLEEHGIVERIIPSLVRGPAKVFKVPEPAKNRWRPIKHTYLINEVLGKDSLPPCHMATKRDIVNMVHSGSHFISLDFAAYYDQFELSEEVSHRICFKKGNKFYRVCTLAMGQRQAVPVAARTTAMFLDIPGCRSTTNSVIDNVIFIGSEEDVLQDAKAFVDRVTQCNGLLNEDTSDLRALRQTKGTWCGVELDLVAKTVALTEKVVAKTKASWERRSSWTYRGLAAHSGLLFYSWGIVEVPMAEFFPMLRFISHCGRLMHERPELWDTPVTIWPSALESLTSWTNIVFENKPRAVHAPADPEWLVCTDASGWGWGYVALNTGNHEVRSFGAPWDSQAQRRYGSMLGRSTVAEPLAIYNAMCHLLTRGAPTRVKVGTDNTAAEASYRRGFNTHSYIINECLLRLHRTFGPDFHFEFKHVPGVENIADPLSRGQRLAQGDWATAQSLRRLVG